MARLAQQARRIEQQPTETKNNGRHRARQCSWRVLGAFAGIIPARAECKERRTASPIRATVRRCQTRGGQSASRWRCSEYPGNKRAYNQHEPTKSRPCNGEHRPRQAHPSQRQRVHGVAVRPAPAKAEQRGEHHARSSTINQPTAAASLRLHQPALLHARATPRAATDKQVQRRDRPNVHPMNSARPSPISCDND